MLNFNKKLTPEHISVMEKFAKYDKSKCEEHFDALAPHYESVYKLVGYPDPQQCADYVT